MTLNTVTDFVEKGQDARRPQAPAETHIFSASHKEAQRATQQVGPYPRNLRIAFASGGSGGHLYPGLAIAEAICSANPGTQCLFFISEKPIEEQIVKKSGFPYRILPSCPPKGPGLLQFGKKFIQGYKGALEVLRAFGAQAMVSLGGYASFAPALAARSLGIPLFLQEQNSVPGRANLALSWMAKAVFAPFAGMERKFWMTKVKATGNPIRASALRQDRELALAKLGLAQDGFTVLVLGGSQGAHALNVLLRSSLRRLADQADGLQWIHLAGGEDAEDVRQAYAREGFRAAVFPYYDNMGVCYGACDLVVARAGASTVAEIIANGLAAVFVPYPGAARDHQRENARWLQEKGAALVLDQDQLTPSSFSTVIKSLQRDPLRLARMRKAAGGLFAGNAAQAICQEISGVKRGQTPFKR